jgi:hypothetical protein
MTPVVKDDAFELVAEFVKLDTKKRISLGALSESTKAMYQVYRNRLGQIVLDPVTAVPAYESWLFQDPEALKRVRQGLQDSADKKFIDLGSFQDAED